jgi:hypothetical protein
VRYSLVVQIRQSTGYFDQLEDVIRQGLYIESEDTNQTFAVGVGIIGRRMEEGAQVVSNPDGDERQPLPTLVLLAIHAKEFDNVGMVELAPRQSFDA